MARKNQSRARTSQKDVEHANVASQVKGGAGGKGKSDRTPAAGTGDRPSVPGSGRESTNKVRPRPFGNRGDNLHGGQFEQAPFRLESGRGHRLEGQSQAMTPAGPLPVTHGRQRRRSISDHAQSRLL
jgi:hypothetical protein